MQPRKYTSAYYRAHHAASRDSARVLLPRLAAITGAPASVVDVGCGDGAWLDVAGRALGVARRVGVDGPWVQPLAGALTRFEARDLEAARLELGGERFDWALSLEVAADLPPERAGSFVAELVALSDIVLFSSAPPGQPHEPHRNRAWPSAWAPRFAEHGYLLVDCIRPAVWDEPAVAPWYAQNCLLFVAAARLEASEALRTAREQVRGMPLDVVHPRLAQPAWDELPLERALGAVREALRRLLQRSRR
ncbi:MAG: hypothetical protein KC503_09590 [Myxococcales bacterium]|nr:hypothetical protein [Myxococcales bacterium]